MPASGRTGWGPEGARCVAHRRQLAACEQAPGDYNAQCVRGATTRLADLGVIDTQQGNEIEQCARWPNGKPGKRPDRGRPLRGGVR